MQSTAPASFCGAAALCLTAFVSSSFRVSAIGIDSASGSIHCGAVEPLAVKRIGRPKVRCTEAVIASTTLISRSGPLSPTCKP